jgi:hypothetical protein
LPAYALQRPAAALVSTRAAFVSTVNAREAAGAATACGRSTAQHAEAAGFMDCTLRCN